MDVLDVGAATAAVAATANIALVFGSGEAFGSRGRAFRGTRRAPVAERCGRHRRSVVARPPQRAIRCAPWWLPTRCSEQRGRPQCRSAVRRKSTPARRSWNGTGRFQLSRVPGILRARVHAGRGASCFRRMEWMPARRTALRRECPLAAGSQIACCAPAVCRRQHRPARVGGKCWRDWVAGGRDPCATAEAGRAPGIPSWRLVTDASGWPPSGCAPGSSSLRL